MDIGTRIKERREELGLSQDELARKLGYKSRSSINKIETSANGLPQKKIAAIATALDTTPAYIMGWEEGEKDDHYYYDDETRRIAQEVFENPDLRSLFHAARDIPPEVLKAHIEFMKSLKAKETYNGEEGC